MVHLFNVLKMAFIESGTWISTFIFTQKRWWRVNEAG